MYLIDSAARKPKPWFFFALSERPGSSLRYGSFEMAWHPANTPVTWGREHVIRMAALAILATHNLVQNRVLNERGYVTGNLAVSGCLVTLGRRARLSPEDMGLKAGDLETGLRIGGGAVLASIAFVAVAPRIPALRERLHDERATAASYPEAIRRALTRFPLGTALFEEVVFRGVLPPLLAADHSRVAGDVESALVFGLWHLIPTHDVLRTNHVGRTRLTRTMGTLLGAAAAGVGGYGLSRIRRRTGSLLAPWLIHSSVNAGSYLGVILARWATRGSRAQPVRNSQLNLSRTVNSTPSVGRVTLSTSAWCTPSPSTTGPSPLS